MTQTNRQIVLKARPKGSVGPEHFESREVPLSPIGEGEALVRTLYLSIDPTIRGWMERDTYLPAIEIGAPIRSAGAGVVVESKSDDLKPGDRVFTLLGWQEYSVQKAGPQIMTIPDGVALEDALSVFGLTGLTAYFGLLDVGQPREGETVVVSGAAGATGSVVGQIAKLKGCHVVGIAGSEAKCAWLRSVGFDEVINYKTEDVAARLRETCPKKIDVYFDNVGGPILDAALMRLGRGGRVVLCGGISQYDVPDEKKYGPRAYLNLIAVRGRMQGFLVMDYASRYMQAIMELAGWVAEGKIQHRTDVVEGLERAPEALMKLFSGANEGKVLVRVSE
jgi:NADPH-dependent curcumin reductase